MAEQIGYMFTVNVVGVMLILSRDEAFRSFAYEFVLEDKDLNDTVKKEQEFLKAYLNLPPPDPPNGVHTPFEGFRFAEYCPMEDPPYDVQISNAGAPGAWATVYRSIGEGKFEVNVMQFQQDPYGHEPQILIWLK